MCIVLVTTAHPRYALIAIDNRDEFILRPTSRPYWWKAVATPAVCSSKTGSESGGAASATSSSSSASSERAPSPDPSNAAQAARPGYNVGPGPAPAPPASTTSSTSPSQPTPHPKEVMILSARDLERAERGTWLGISKEGNFAVLTNYRETNTHNSAHPVHSARSRGGMVTAWLCADPKETIEGFCHRMLVEEGVQSVGGFSLICGKLRKRHPTPESGETAEVEPLAIISNRHQRVDQVPRIAGHRGETVALSNACYGDTEKWPKVDNGREILAETIADAVSKNISEDELIGRLFEILDRDTMPDTRSMGFEDAIMQLKKSIFIPAIGDEQHRKQMEEEQAKGKGMEEGHKFHPPPEGHHEDKMMGFMTGMYGTQRQTVMLVDWDGKVTFIERALWDAHGNPVPRGQGDLKFEFAINGWQGEGTVEGTDNGGEDQLRCNLS